MIPLYNVTSSNRTPHTLLTHVSQHRIFAEIGTISEFAVLQTTGVEPISVAKEAIGQAKSQVQRTHSNAENISDFNKQWPRPFLDVRNVVSNNKALRVSPRKKTQTFLARAMHFILPP